ncbi:G-type lectin S-receptor-like serine/threonine-protein kinase At4g27290 isoform X2 [Telopea speciosissima]|uniref:G-type lectin S-receptor-like serine/threonine-protein kinase At4g27290 isoform X2 n=1 Tax=Telopea speciosissima TaxID=54955 RepID=UPI001CC6D1CD|nr:G-type lectin S-receptor-like serine/threonine-protein kinase At4g27290 isoform X2 [Telopea speciosissima]
MSSTSVFPSIHKIVFASEVGAEEEDNQKKSMASFSLLVSFTVFLCFCSICTVSIAVNAITRSQPLRDGQTLVSGVARFELGFFSARESRNRYVGIWYMNIPVQTLVWVANRDNPLNDSSGVLRIDARGNLVLVNQINYIFWSSNSSRAAENPVVELLESGNLVLQDKKDAIQEDFLWQSFDYPSDTLLPGMKLGWNLKTGLNRGLTSWKSTDDPSSGELRFGIELHGYPEAVMWNGKTEHYRSGPWNGLRYSGAPELAPNTVFSFSFTANADEVYYMYQLSQEGSILSRLVLNQSSNNGGELQRLTWNTKSNSWQLFLSVPRDYCDNYGLCGAYSNCDMNQSPLCRCLQGFKPKSPGNWNSLDWSGGCVQKTALGCSERHGFMKFSGLKLPDTRHTWVNRSMDLEECEVECLKNCSCTAYARADVRGGGSGCALWYGDLIDIRQFPINSASSGQDFFIRVDSSELAAQSDSNSKKKVKVRAVVVVAIVSGMLLLGCSGFHLWNWKKKARLEGKEVDTEEKDIVDKSRMDDLELSSFDLATIARATNNFSDSNKLGEGGFGPVYKGVLFGGREIAVKRLSKNSVQGLDEFKNEVILISKLQHRNLVKVLGCCIEGAETMLVYEYMVNKSLDYYIFDEKRSTLLDWEKRFNIVFGIARGLLYLHQDSRLRIIHRDLKASNILLDCNMEPKISDFGMARIFGGDQIEAETNKVVGTYGYMSPEYAIEGLFSVKSDVFSFGVLVLEMVSGKKNRGFYHPEHQLNLLGHAWTLWNEEKALELIDPTMRDSCVATEVLRCIHVGLLCVQQQMENRPTMSSVVFMLGNGNAVLPQPQQPGFFAEKYSKASSFSSMQHSSSLNCVTVTLLSGR